MRIIELHGDSTQRGGLQPPRPYSLRPVELLQGLLDKYAGLAVWHVVDKAIGAQSAKEAMTEPQVPYGDKTFPEWMQLSTAEIVVANWGINDAADATIDQWQFASYHRSARDWCLATNKTFVSETANPVTISPSLTARVNEFNTRLKEQAAFWGWPVVDTDACVRAIPGWEGLIPDGLHPSAMVYYEKTINLFERLRALGLV